MTPPFLANGVVPGDVFAVPVLGNAVPTPFLGVPGRSWLRRGVAGVRLHVEIHAINNAEALIL